MAATSDVPTSMPPATAAATAAAASRSRAGQDEGDEEDDADRGEQPQGSEQADHEGQRTARTRARRVAERYRRSGAKGHAVAGRDRRPRSAAGAERRAPCYTPPVPVAAGAPASRPAGVEPSSEVGPPVPRRTERPHPPSPGATAAPDDGGRLSRRSPARAPRAFFIARGAARGATEGARRCRRP